MLLAVFLFFLLAGMFYMLIKLKGLHSQATELEENKAVLMAGFISGSTEFACAGKEFCIDTDKLLVLKNRSVYGDLWPVSSITVRKIYPKTQTKECTLGNYPDCNQFMIYSKKTNNTSSIASFVALCRHEKSGDYLQEICEMGKISIGYEIK